MPLADLKTVTESLLRTIFGSEFQTAGTEHRKAHFAKIVVVDVWHSDIVADGRS